MYMAVCVEAHLPWCCHVHHLDGAARQAKGHRPDRTLTHVVDQIVHLSKHLCAFACACALCVVRCALCVCVCVCVICLVDIIIR